MEIENTNLIATDALSQVGITISAEIGITIKTVKEVMRMGLGTIVELDKLAEEPVDLKANGVLFAKGEVVVINEKFGVRIIDICDQESPVNEPEEQIDSNPRDNQGE